MAKKPLKAPIKRPPGETPDAREKQIIALAMDVAEQKLRDGTASSQLVTELVRRASAKDRLEKEILEMQKGLISAKTEALASTKRSEELFAEALKAMRSYNGIQGEGEQDGMPPDLPRTRRA